MIDYTHIRSIWPDCILVTCSAHLCLIFFFPAATKADGFALYFLGECNNVSSDFFCFFTDASLCICSFFLQLCFTSCSCLFFSTEFMFIHSNGGQGWASIPHPLWPHRIWDNHCRSCCQDSQNTASRGRHGGMCGCHPSTV